MNRPQHGILTMHETMSPRRVASLAAVGVLHVAVIYAIASGLANKIVKQIPPVLEASIIEQTVEQPKEMVVPKPQMEQPQEATIAPPDFVIETTTPPPMQVAVAPTAPTAPLVSAAASSINNTHTTPPYPEQARRLGLSGTVRLHLFITAQGTVSNATVVTSSGNAELDTNAVSWVIKHWKYKPALASGTAVASEADANVVYDLKQLKRG